MIERMPRRLPGFAGAFSMDLFCENFLRRASGKSALLLTLPLTASPASAVAPALEPPSPASAVAPALEPPSPASAAAPAFEAPAPAGAVLMPAAAGAALPALPPVRSFSIAAQSSSAAVWIFWISSFIVHNLIFKRCRDNQIRVKMHPHFSHFQTKS